MRIAAPLVLAVTAIGWIACGRTPMAQEVAPDEAIVAAGSEVTSATPPLPPVDAGTPPRVCGYDPPDIFGPADGTVVQGRVPITVAVPEGPCNITASTVVTIADAAGVPVRRFCTFPFEAPLRWQTTEFANGQYWITAQRACSCTPCREFSYVGVTVAN